MTQPAKAQSIIGKIIADTVIERKLGAGGMGAVFAGTHNKMQQCVAVKLLPAVPPPPPQFVQRFFREARAMRQLTHPKIARVYDVGQQDPFYFIVMEFVEARPLEEIVREKNRQKDRIKISRALRIVRDVADAMAYCHERGVLHRDLKPDNILLNERTGDVKVIDFGLAKVEAGEGQALTVTGQIMGTPMYMAPEQAEGKVADHRTDIYSLGACAFFFLTGDFPYLGRSGMDILLKKIKEGPRDMRELRPEIPKPVADLVQRMMARNPNKRFQSMARVRDILSQALKPRTKAPAGSSASASVSATSGTRRHVPQGPVRPGSSASHPAAPATGSETRQVATRAHFRVSGADSGPARTAPVTADSHTIPPPPPPPPPPTSAIRRPGVRREPPPFPRAGESSE